MFKKTAQSKQSPNGRNSPNLVTLLSYDRFSIGKKMIL
jgi:hypothetical protein